MKRYRCFLLCLLLVATRVEAQPLQLITEAEARLPAALASAEAAPTRAITRNPGISLVSAETVAKDGFPLRIVFEPRGGIAIEPESVRIVYLKNPPVDLTPRLKEKITPTGVEVPAATAPPGDHPLQVTVRDKNGRESVKKINLVVR